MNQQLWWLSYANVGVVIVNGVDFLDAINNCNKLNLGIHGEVLGFEIDPNSIPIKLQNTILTKEKLASLNLLEEN